MSGTAAGGETAAAGGQAAPAQVQAQVPQAQVPQAQQAAPAGACGACGGAPAAYARAYSGERLCASCFTRSIERKAARTMSRHSMIRDSDLNVCVAVSGGKDSLALLRVLHRMSGRRRFALSAVIIDEGIPGYRDEALGIAESYCAGLGVPLAARSYKELFGTTLDEALRDRDGPKAPTSCSICGTLRRRAIDVAAAEAGADVVATAHNLDDALQTFLINVMSGDTDRIGRMLPGGGGALAGSAPRRIQPFCEIYEQEIVFYAFVNGIPFQAEPCPHMNEGVRTGLREFLNGLEAAHAGLKNGMYRSVMRLAEAVAAGGGKEAVRCPSCGAPCTSGAGCSVCRTLAGLRAGAGKGGNGWDGDGPS